MRSLMRWWRIRRTLKRIDAVFIHNYEEQVAAELLAFRPCEDCGHSFIRHTAVEGACLDCACIGWTIE